MDEKRVTEESAMPDSTPDSGSSIIREKEPAVATEGVLSSGEEEPEVVSEPYSIYSPKEKWFIVAIVAIAGFYRYGNLILRPCNVLGVD